MFSESYVRLILAAAPFVVCLALALEPEFKRRAWVWIGGAVLFAVGVGLRGAAPWACLPWFLSLLPHMSVLSVEHVCATLQY